eukprot:83089-Alexandrium_andersonii.AAC.2
MAAADGDGTAKRAWPACPSDDLAAKRRRAGLEKQTRLGLTDDQVGLLALVGSEVDELDEAGVEAWATAVLREGKQKGSVEDESRGIGKVLKVLRDNEVTGAALVKLTVDKLTSPPYGLAGGPAELLVSRLAPSPAEQFDLATEEGRKRLVEALAEQWGLRGDRFDRPARLTTDEFSFSQTQERED